ASLGMPRALSTYTMTRGAHHERGTGVHPQVRGSGPPHRTAPESWTTPRRGVGGWGADPLGVADPAHRVSCPPCCQQPCRGGCLTTTVRPDGSAWHRVAPHSPPHMPCAMVRGGC